jgi:hypothetical protein
MNFNVTNPIQGDSEMSDVTVPIEETVKPEAPKRQKQELTAEEREPLHKFETAYLKAQIQINALTTQTTAAQKGFTEAVETLGKKYEINPQEMQFDNNAYAFVATK